MGYKKQPKKLYEVEYNNQTFKVHKVAGKGCRSCVFYKRFNFLSCEKKKYSFFKNTCGNSRIWSLDSKDIIIKEKNAHKSTNTNNNWTSQYYIPNFNKEG